MTLPWCSSMPFLVTCIYCLCVYILEYTAKVIIITIYTQSQREKGKQKYIIILHVLSAHQSVSNELKYSTILVTTDYK